MNTRVMLRLTLLVAMGGCDSGANRTPGGGLTGDGTGGQGLGGGGNGGATPGAYCHLVGCGAIWNVRRALPAELAVSEIQGLRVEVCRNEWCFGTSFADFLPSEPFMRGGGLGRTLPQTGDGDPHIDVIFWGTDAGKAGEVEVSWSFGSRAGAAGDVFSVDLVRTGGTSVLRVEETVAYETISPNGVDCPPLCQHAVRRDP